MPDQTNEDDKNRLISLAEAADIYGLTPDHLRHLAQRKRLKAKKIAGVWLTTRASVEEYLENRYKRGRKPQ